MALSFAAQGEILMYDGFPTGSEYYSTGKTKITGTTPQGGNIIGFSGHWDSGTGVIYTHGSGTGLSLPDGFEGLPSAAYVGDGSAGATSSGAESERGVWRSLSETAQAGLKSAGSFYFRELLHADSSALSALTARAVPEDGVVANLGCSAYGGGLVLSPSLVYGSWHNSNGSTARSLSFCVRRNAASDYRLSLVVMGTEDDKKVRVYDLITNVDPAKTYICYAEVENNDSGSEAVRAFAQDVLDYSPVKEFDVETTANLIDGTGSGCLTAYNFSAGSYKTNGGFFKIDEIALATTSSDIMKLGVAGAPALSTCALSGGAGSYTLSGVVTLADAADAGVEADDGVNDPIGFSAGAVAQDTTMTKTFSVGDLSANTTYLLSAYAANDKGRMTMKVGSVYTGTLTLTKLNDADEYKCVPGRVTVSRANADPIPLTVSYTLTSASGTGGTTWEMPEDVIIPAGETSATLTLKPLKDGSVSEDITVTLALSGGLCSVNAATVDLTLANMRTPAGKKCWFPSVSTKASDGDNWSPAGVPLATDDILVDGDFADVEMEWDAGVNGLPATVNSWIQQAYTKAVSFDTTYDGSFSVFTVTRDVTISSGRWTHPANTDSQLYHLDVAVGGSLSLAAGASIDVLGRGFAKGKYPAGSDVACHACSPQGSYSKVYGDVREPISLGAGGHASGASCGGGAVKLAVTGDAVIDGTIDARSSSQKASDNPEKGVGAGGSIWVTAATISGSGTVTASAYTADVSETSYAEGGSGGRIALVATSGAVSLARSSLQANGGYGSATSGGGTIFIKDASDANGTLLVGTTKGHEWSYQVRYPKAKSTTIVRPGETWKFDRVLLRGQGILSVPPEATLELANGFASVSNDSPSDTARQCGILYLGGSIVTPETTEHVLTDRWLFMAIEPFTFNASVKLDYYAGFGNFFLLQPTPTNSYQNVITVNGNLTLAYNEANKGAASGVLYTNQRGNRGTTGQNTYGAHGGSVGDLSAAYDSIFHPKHSGYGGQAGDAGNTNDGSGAIKLTVTGKFTNNGIVDLCGSARSGDHPRGGAGALDLTCGSIETKTEGNQGLIKANGYAGSSSKPASAGGRVAIKLTDRAATFDAATLASVSALGAKSDAANAAAGTIYLQEGNQSDGAGLVVVRGSAATSVSTVPTVFPASKWGAEDSKAFSQTGLSVEGTAAVRISDTMKLRTLNVEEGSVLDLNGVELTVKRVVLGGQKVPPGRYKASSFADSLKDSSADDSGVLMVGGLGYVLYVR